MTLYRIDTEPAFAETTNGGRTVDCEFSMIERENLEAGAVIHVGLEDQA
jgi:hypothetical protein